MTNWGLGRSYFDEQDYTTAIQEFQKVLSNYPSSNDLSDAQLWIGKCRFEMMDYTSSYFEFQKVLTNYPGSNDASTAQLWMGHCLKEQQQHIAIRWLPELLSKVEAGLRDMGALPKGRMLENEPGEITDPAIAVCVVRGGREGET